MAQKLYQFEIFVNGEKVDEKQIEVDGPVKIGSHNRVDLHVPDDTVSRVHALLEMNEQGVPAIIDLGSGRGTFVNGKRVNKCALRNGDVIRVGATEIRFRLYEPRKAGAKGSRTVNAVPATVTYSRRYLSRPARTDGTVEVAVLWRDTVISDELYNPAENITVGMADGEGKDDKDVTIRIDDPLLGNSHLLIEADEEGQNVALRLLDGMAGELFIGSERYAIGDAIAAGVLQQKGNAYVTPLNVETRARIDFGRVSIFVHRSIKPAAVIGRSFRIRGYGILLIALLLSAIFQFGMVFLGYLMPPDYSMKTNEQFDANSRFVQMVVTENAEEQKDEVPDWLKDEDNDKGKKEKPGVKSANNSQSNSNSNAPANPNAQPSDGPAAELSEHQATEEALQTGAVAALQNFGSSSGFGGSAGNLAGVVALGNSGGVAIAGGYGAAGIADYGGGLSTGSAIGGGGGGGGGFGIGPMAVRGRSTGTGVGVASSGLAKKKTRNVAVKPGKANIQGQLDKEIIKRVIRQHRREIRACYSQQLQRDPDLKGRIDISFVIDPSGNVASSKVSKTTMHSKAVEDCITLRVRRWRFPQPKGGGVVKVNYPFTFVSE